MYNINIRWDYVTKYNNKEDVIIVSHPPTINQTDS